MDRKIDVSLWGPSIRTSSWLEIYEKLKSTNSCNFKIFFCGQIRPNFTLPDEFVYIHSSMNGIAPHAEIARRFAINSKPHYVMSMVDDLVLSNSLLDGLIQDVESFERETVTGPAFIPDANLLKKKRSVKEMSINMDVDRDKCLGMVLRFMKTSTAEKIGGIDKRFSGIAFDRDLILQLREHENIQFRTTDAVWVAEDLSIQLNIAPAGSVSSRASRKFGDSHSNRADGLVHKSIWEYNYKNFVDGVVRRKTSNLFYEDNELSFDR